MVTANNKVFKFEFPDSWRIISKQEDTVYLGVSATYQWNTNRRSVNYLNLDFYFKENE